MRRAFVLVAALTFIVSAGLLRSSEAASGNVICLHGWNGSASNCDTLKARYEAQGYTVHALSLPRSGSSAGDTVINADYVQAYIASNNLTDVKLDGHSLGGWLALTVALVRQDGAVSSVVLRDSGYGGIGCWLVPDLCSNSAAVAAVKNAPLSSVPILNLNSSTAPLPQVDCLKVYSGLAHNDFLTNPAVTAAAIGWPVVNPCATPTPTATPSATTTPTATPTPAPCSWWDRLWGRC